MNLRDITLPQGTSDAKPLAAPWTMRFTYTRTYGPVVGRFMAGLAEKKLLGVRAKDGSVFCPPTGYDPRDSTQLDDWVELPSAGIVEALAWVDRPAEHHPFDTPFGWAEIRVDGASSCLTHFVQGERARLQPGSRVEARWADDLT